MEQSEKRKERLKAIREEAAEAGDNTEEQNSVGHGLANPLNETPSAPSRQDEPRPRFDYYTDSMAAFSTNNKKNSISPQVQQPCNTPPRPMNAGSPAYHAHGNYNSTHRTYQTRGVNAIPFGIRRNSSNTLDSSLSTPNNCSPPNSPQVGDISSDGFPQGVGAGSPYQGLRFKGRPSRGSRQGRGRFKFYYHKSMVEDPWKVLKPVIWKPRGDTCDSLKSWLPNSIRPKRLNLERLRQRPLPGKASLNTWLLHSMKQLAKTL